MNTHTFINPFTNAWFTILDWEHHHACSNDIRFRITGKCFFVASSRYWGRKNDIIYFYRINEEQEEQRIKKLNTYEYDITVDKTELIM